MTWWLESIHGMYGALDEKHSREYGPALRGKRV